jgi:hypothetical protein
MFTITIGSVICTKIAAKFSVGRLPVDGNSLSCCRSCRTFVPSAACLPGRQTGCRKGQLPALCCSSVARWRICPPDLEISGGFESQLAGKIYFWRTACSGGFLADFDSFLQDNFCLADLADFWRFWTVNLVFCTFSPFYLSAL